MKLNFQIEISRQPLKNIPTLKNKIDTPYYIVLIIMTILCTSCSDSDTVVDYGVPVNTINYQFEKDLAENEDYYDLIDSIEILSLESSEDFLIGNISGIQFNSKELFILDKKLNVLFKFSREGKGLMKIDSKGRGPGEYSKISDFAIYDNHIALLDGGTGKLLLYSLDGDFIDEFKIKTGAKFIGNVDDELLAAINANVTSMWSDKNVSIFDKKGDKLQSYMNVPTYVENKNLSLSKPVDYFKKELLYTNPFLNKVFRITKDSLIVKYAFNFGEYNLNQKFLIQNKKLGAGDLFMKLNKEEDMVNVMDFFNETPKYISFRFLKKGKSHFSFYDKSNDKKYIFESKKFPDWFGKINRPFLSSSPTENSFVAVSLPKYIQDIQGRSFEKGPMKLLKKSSKEIGEC